MILLDTNIISELMRLSPNEKVVKNVNKFSANTTFISAITYAEILQGIALLNEGKRKQNLAKIALLNEGKRKQNLAKIAHQVLQLFNKNTLAFDQQSAPFYAEIIQQRTQLGRPIDFPDAQIATIALQHNLQLFTRNVRDFEKITNLRLINPWE